MRAGWERAWRGLAAMAFWVACMVGQAVGGVEVVRQGDFVVGRLSNKDGLPLANCTAVAQSGDGHLWIGTLRGISRYDGERFYNYEADSLPGLPAGDVLSLATTDDGHVWLGMRLGLYRLTPGRDRVEREVGVPDRCSHLVAIGDEVVAGGTWGLARGRAGAVRGVLDNVPVEGLAATGEAGAWYSTSDGLFRLASALEGVPKKPVVPGKGTLGLVARDGMVWASVGGSLHEVDGKTARVRHTWTNLAFQPLLADTRGLVWCRAGGLDAEDLVAVITTSNRALVKFGEAMRPTDSSTKRGIEDESGTRWFPTASGLASIRDTIARVYGMEEGLPSRGVWSVDFHPDAGLWVGTDAGPAHERGGRLHFDPAHGYGSTHAIHGAGPGQALASMGGRLQRLSPGRAQLADGRLPGGFHFVSRDRAGRMVAGGRGGIWIQEPAGEWKPVAGLASEATWIGWDEGAGGEAFASSLDKGLHRRAGHGAWQRVALPGGPSSAAVVWRGMDDRVWVGSDMGLYRSREDGGWNHWTKGDGLIENVVLSAQPDHAGHLWLLGLRGISRLSVTNLLEHAAGRASRVHPWLLGTREGVDEVEGNAGFPSSTREPDGTLWFATTRGLVRVRPQMIREPAPPRPLILEVHDMATGLRQDPRQAGGQGVFKRGTGRSLRFRFGAVQPSGSRGLWLQYRLAGTDKDWINADEHREAVYVGLRPGRHEFEVRAAADDGDWNPHVATWVFESRPAWWEETWLHGAVALAMVGGTAWGVSRRIRSVRELGRLRQARALEAERQRLARDMHDGLGSEIARLHLAAATGTVDVVAASHGLLERLRNLVWVTDPAEDRLDATVRAMAMRVERFFPDGIPEVLVEVPPQLAWDPLDGHSRRELMAWLDEGLANVARHARAREVRFRARHEGGVLELELADDGVGMDLGSIREGARGLANQRARIHGLGGVMEVRSAPGKGTRILAVLPWPLRSPRP